MAARTYLPTFRIILNRTSVYTARYQTIIEAALTPTQLTAFLAFLVCLSELISALGPTPIED